ncbi:enterotoxin [bacterium]|nr:enterotoxin [bacterium]
MSGSYNDLKIIWRATLRDGANYVRQEFDIEPTLVDKPIKDITLFDFELPGARLSGPATGAPIVTDTVFMGIEDPMSSGTLTAGRAQTVLHVGMPIRKGQHFVRSTVIGVAPEGQLRRSFLYYLERERAHPYRPFLHYNSWWDIGCDPKLPVEKWLNNFNEAECLARIDAFNRELVEKRGVVMDSFLFDDGWDDIDTVWEFNRNFPNGFAKLTEATRKHNIGLGVWLSPFGGYHVKHDRRIAAGRKAGYEIIEHGGFTYGEAGFALSGAKYYKRFLDVTTTFIKKYDVNMFKFDGISRNAIAPAGSPFSSDFQASIQMLRDLRDAKHDVFINLTTGTWASPFWMLWADSIWRGESDCNWMGAGSKRQQWITYRDAITYKNIVRGCELYPLNSLMNCGLIYSVAMQPTDPSGDFKDEVRSFFGSGTHLQEMYCAPTCLKNRDWNWIAEGAKWSRKHAGVLVDTHWVGGDPGKSQVYGWAAWTPKGATLTLRNPGDKPQEFTVDAQSAFELPAKAPQKYAMKAAYADQRLKELNLNGAEKVKISLEPFEVLVFDHQ